MGRPRKMKRPFAYTHATKRSRGNCGYCGLPVYKRPAKYAGHVFHSKCLVRAVKEGKV